MNFTVYIGDVFDALRQIPAGGVDAIMTSPPYWGLRDYGIDGQIGLEPTPQEYIGKMVEVSEGIKRVLKPSGSYWLNIGDTYWGGGRGGQPKYDNYNEKRFKHGHPIWKANGHLTAKQKLLMPHRLAIALQDAGWICRNDVVWHKPSHMPSSVKDRLTCSFEFVFHFVKQRKYFYDLGAIREKHKHGAQPFNYRVREAEQKGEQCPQFKASDEEIEQYRNKTADEGKFKTGRGMRQAPEPGEPNAFHPSGKNPGDAWNKKWDYDEMMEWQKNESTIHGDKAQHPAGKNPSDFWVINPQPFPEAHFACFPQALVRKPLKATVPKDGMVLDPFLGSGTTLQEAMEQGKNGIGIELNPKYAPMIMRRLNCRARVARNTFQNGGGGRAEVCHA